jgi:hypothetical protein
MQSDCKVSTVSCPVRKTRMSPGRGSWVWIWMMRWRAAERRSETGKGV